MIRVMVEGEDTKQINAMADELCALISRTDNGLET